MEALCDRVAVAAAAFPKPDGFVPSYGTAGFRADASLLPSTVFRCGLVMALRARKAEASTGLVITASHNPAADNGVKLVEPSGYMLAPSWEVHAERLAQSESTEAVLAALLDIIRQEQIFFEAGSGEEQEQEHGGGGGRVLVAHDTRPSAAALTEAAVAGVTAAGGTAVVLGTLTTPQLHWIVRRTHEGLPSSEEDYYLSLDDAFSRLLASSPSRGSDRQVSPLAVDCAFGVGGQKLGLLQAAIGPARLPMQLLNVTGGQLNEGCGSDFVEKQRQLPANFGNHLSRHRCASMDGDADRLVYFRVDDDDGGGGTMRLFDGDRIAILAARLIQNLLSQLPPSTASLGVVQTVYANGASTLYLQNVLRCTVVTALTGVKHLHHEAAKFGVGIYFEANGHGTILFSRDLINRLSEMKEHPAAADLLALAQMVNQAVGDALSNILLVELCLARQGWDMGDWASLYSDLPSRQLKVRVRDRMVIKTTDADRRTVSPAGLQEEIDRAVAGVPSGRAFVRPSGTEDVVRVYAEADTQEHADELAAHVARLVHKLADGIGPAP